MEHRSVLSVLLTRKSFAGRRTLFAKSSRSSRLRGESWAGLSPRRREAREENACRAWCFPPRRHRNLRPPARLHHVGERRFRRALKNVCPSIKVNVQQRTACHCRRAEFVAALFGVDLSKKSR